MGYVARWLGTPLLVGTFVSMACTDSAHVDASGQGGTPQSGGTPSTDGQVKAGSGGVAGGGGGVPSEAAGGGSAASGGQPATGGRTSTGGTIAAGGSAQTGDQTGGTTSRGGTPASGGSPAADGALTGGSVATGGRASLGGISATGGTPATGGTNATGGVNATGGATATGGASATGGATGTGGSTSPSCGSIASTTTRPQLSTADAANYTTTKYLAGSDNWNPTAGITLPGSPTYTVAADGSGDSTTVKGALAKATGSSRVNILIKAGTYREKISISGSTPITLYGTDADASKVVIAYGDSSDSAGGTPQSATFTVSNPGFQAKNLTLANDLDENASGCTNCQAVAFYSTGDKLVFDNVRFIGNQDTIYFETTGTVARVYLKNSFVEGDTDYIFGRATVVLEDSEMHYTSLRKPTNAGRQIAPSTAAANKYGYLFNRCKFTADAATLTNKIYLGRSWDQNVATAADWNASSSPNGQAVIRESVLGAHIRLADPWAAAATSGRAYDSSTNRLVEYCNTGPGAG
ncbi:MAG TPA: pectinesterase family protein [Polyangia bacterium]